MELWIGGINLGLLYAFMTIGVFITFRVHDFPDITVDGSFTCGAAVAAVLISGGVNPFLAMSAAFASGLLAGTATGIIHARLNINGLLAGILVMTGLYSINLHIMGRSNIPLLNQVTFLTYLRSTNPGMHSEIWTAVVLVVVMGLFWLLLALFFRTDFGLLMRATGNNATMAASVGVNVNRMKIFGIALSNGLVGLSGALVAQYQGFADIGMGIGTVVIGLAAVIIGESVVRKPSMAMCIFGIILGSLLFRMMIAAALYVGMNPIDLKLLTAVFVLVTLFFSKALSHQNFRLSSLKKVRLRFIPKHKTMGVLGTLLVVVMVGSFAFWKLSGNQRTNTSFKRIGVVQFVDNELLNITRDSFLRELERIGYKSGENLEIVLANANGDLPTVNTILDKFLNDRIDIVVPLSTACAQAAVNKIKDRPVVFATVANPFILGIGRSDTDHRANVTGVYGWAPMEKMMAVLRAILPGKISIGAIWDPSQSNSEFNVDNLRKVISEDDTVTFIGATITGSSEVHQAAMALVQKGIDAFVLTPDHHTYAAFEAVVKAASARRIPIFISDVERLADGALCALGYDYSSSGIQAAHLVDRILKGENPSGIPLERYRKLSFGFNLKVAEELGITIPSDLLKEATILLQKEPQSRSSITESSPADSSQVLPAPAALPKRLALFLFSDTAIMQEGMKGLFDELQEDNFLDREELRVDIKCAQNELSMAQSIAQDIVRLHYDFLITLSTPALQMAAQFNKTIPHVFGLVLDPYRMGVAEDAARHLPWITGVATLQPVEATFQTMRTILPKARRVGIVWNPGEACSEACTLKARLAADQYGFELLEATVTSTGEVLDAVKSLINRGIDTFLTSGDNTVNLVVASIGEILKQNKIPYFTNSPSDIERSALVSIGADYYQVGRETGRIARKVISGQLPKNLPIMNFAPDKTYINLALANEFGLEIPSHLLDKAAFIRR